MMSKENQNMTDSEFIGLLSTLVDQRAGQDDLDRLSRELVENPIRRRIYIEYIAIHAELTSSLRSDDQVDCGTVVSELELILNEDSQGQLVELPEVTSDASPSAFRGASWASVACLVTILIFCGQWIYSSVSEIAGRIENFERNPRVLQANAELQKRNDAIDIEKEAVALVSHATGVTQSSEGTQLKEGTSLSPGTLEFESGVIKVEFFTGVTMYLEGPAKFDIVDSMNGFIHNGSLRVLVPEHAKGFTIGSNKFDVEDLGTEFGINVGADGNSEVHVIDGEVRVKNSQGGTGSRYLLEEPDESNSTRLLVRGEGLRASSDGLNEIEGNEELFVGPRQFHELMLARQVKKYDSWSASMEQIKNDPATIALYTFPNADSDVVWDRTLFNVASDKFNGSIVGCNWGEGRLRGKRSLVYSGVGDRIRLDISGKYKALTLSAWVKLDKFGSFPGSRVALLHPDTQSGSGFVHWTLDPIAKGAFLHLAVTDRPDGENQERRHYSSGKLAVPKSDIGRWIQLVTTYDPENRLVNHYCNGEALRRFPIERVQEIEIGLSNIGNWPYRDWAKGTAYEFRNLNGAVDEFFVLSRVLRDEEVKALYEAGVPAH